MARKQASKPGPLAVSGSSALVPITGSERAAAKVHGSDGMMEREQGTTLVTGLAYAAGEHTLTAAEIFFVEEAKPRAEGPWLHEADKVAWRDEASGFECIMLRARDGGYLSGYVGVPKGHPLWGWEHEAVTPELGIEVHGGLTYSAICEDGPSPERRIIREAQRICHVPRTPPRYEPLRHASDYCVEDAHAWWFGFDCNHVYDLVPGARRGERFLGAETGGVYRDDAYVVREILHLAAQLRAIADGKDAPSRDDAPIPPIGLDPRWAG